MARLRPHARKLVAAVAVVVAVLPFVVTSSMLFDLTLMFIFGILAFSAIFPIGYAGQLILAQGAFFGIGAYSFVLLGTRGVPSVVAIVAATGIAALVAYALGKPAVRAHGIYLGIITLAFNMLFVIALELFPDVTGGTVGLSSPNLFPDVVTSFVAPELLLYYAALIAYVGVFFAFRRMLGSETGSAFLAIKEEESLAESIGIDTHRYRLRSFTLAGAVCGLAGGLYAPVNGYISPPMFDLDATIDIILAGVAGGLMTPIGSIFGAAVVVLVPEFLRPIADFRLIVYGVLLILLLAYLPQGIGGWFVEQWRES